MSKCDVKSLEIMYHYCYITILLKGRFNTILLTLIVISHISDMQPQDAHKNVLIIVQPPAPNKQEHPVIQRTLPNGYL